MRKDITETPNLRANRTVGERPAEKRRTVLPLPADAVDAVFADDVSVDQPLTDADSQPLTYSEVVASVTEQLDQLETQRRQLKKLLDQAAQGLS